MIVGLFLRGIKAYKNITFIPMEKSNFVSYIGKNGIGKSSILEALDCFFNSREYPINKHTADLPYIIPLFFIQKDKLKEVLKQNQDQKEILEQCDALSDFFWNLDKRKLHQGSVNVSLPFFALRERLSAYKGEYYFFAIGEEIDGGSLRQSIGTFQHYEDKEFNLPDSHLLLRKNYEDEGERGRSRNKKSKDNLWLQFLKQIKGLYSYIYIPVETDMESFTKLETQEMQKIVGKTLKNKISEILQSATKLDGINKELNSFINEIQETLKNEYTYETGQARNNKLTESDLIRKILEAYFQKRVLHKQGKKARDLSSGEKKKALVDVTYAFLADKTDERDKFVILAIDEPESSLHARACFEQFEKLHQISQQADMQVLLTTHWYGFLPIVGVGYGHFLYEDDGKISFESYNLCNYRSEIREAKKGSTKENKIPHHSELKSVNDLVQSIFYSLYEEVAYNWLLVEGLSDKIYCEYFFKDLMEDCKLRILALGGKREVKKVFDHLVLPLVDSKSDRQIKGKVFCLIDTDSEVFGEGIKQGGLEQTLLFQRFNEEGDFVELVDIRDSSHVQASIENALSPLIFQETFKALEPQFSEPKIELKIKDKNANTTMKNMGSFELDEYFSADDGMRKVPFAQKYVEILKQKEDPNEFRLSWVDKINLFFKEKEQ